MCSVTDKMVYDNWIDNTIIAHDLYQTLYVVTLKVFTRPYTKMSLGIGISKLCIKTTTPKITNKRYYTLNSMHSNTTLNVGVYNKKHNT